MENHIYIDMGFSIHAVATVLVCKVLTEINVY